MPFLDKITTRFVILILIILCSFFLTLSGSMTGKEFQSLVTLSVTVYGGVGLAEYIRKKRSIDEDDD